MIIVSTSPIHFKEFFWNLLKTYVSQNGLLYDKHLNISFFFIHINVGNCILSNSSLLSFLDFLVLEPFNNSRKYQSWGKLYKLECFHVKMNKRTCIKCRPVKSSCLFLLYMLLSDFFLVNHHAKSPLSLHNYHLIWQTKLNHGNNK